MFLFTFAFNVFYTSYIIISRVLSGKEGALPMAGFITKNSTRETGEMEDHKIGVSLVSWLLWKEDEITQVLQQDLLLD